MLLAGTDVTITDSNGITALPRAALRGDPIIVQSLLQHGALVNARNSDQSTPLMISVFAFHYADLAAVQRTVELLVNADAELDAVNCTCDTALSLAVAGKGLTGVGQQIPAAVGIILIEAGSSWIRMRRADMDWRQVQTPQFWTQIRRHRCTWRHGAAISW